MRFQTKLVVTLVTVVLAVTIALIFATEAKIRQTYVSQFSAEFQSLLNGLERSRKNRSDEFMALCRELADHPFIRESLKERAFLKNEQQAAFWKEYRAILESLEPSRQPSGPATKPASGRPVSADLLNKFGKIAIMTLEGQVIPLEFERNSGKGAGRLRRPNIAPGKAKAAVQRFTKSDHQQTVFLPMDFDNRRPIIQEMVSTPVIDPRTGEILGQFLRSSTSETDAERYLERYQEEFEISDRKKTGVFLGGEVYSRSLSPEFSDKLGSDISAFLEDRGAGDADSPLETEIGDEAYVVYAVLISPEEALQPAYQIAAFPISKLKSDLAEFRIRGSGIGAIVLLVSIGLAFLLAKNLAGPISDLSTGTKAIQRGDFDHRVNVKSSDEIGELAASFNEMAEELKQKALYRELLGKVSDETVAQALVSGSLDLELGGEMKEVSVLFCDIRGFTRQTEEMHPTEVIAMLNEHMTAMTELVRIHGGVVDKFVGDEIMAVFGALKSYGNDAANAASCALEMIEKRRLLNDSQSLNVEIGIGVATGEVVAGCMGSVDRLNYTVLGSRVNLAARLGSAAAPMEVVTDDETISRIHPSPNTELISELELKGFSKPVEAFRLRSLESREEERQHAPQT